MEPLNKKERTSLFFQFLLFYLISVVLIIIAMHFYYTIPEAELNALREQREKFKSYDDVPRDALHNILSIDSLFGHFEDLDASPSLMSDDITLRAGKLAELGKEKKNALDSILVQLRIGFLKELDDKKRLRDNQSLMEANKQLREEKLKLQDKLDRCEETRQQLMNK